MSTTESFDRILDSLHDATLDDAHWLSTSTLIDRACGTRGTSLTFGYNGVTVRDSLIMFARMSYHGERKDEMFAEYMRDYFRQDEQIPRLMTLPDKQIARIPDLYTEAERRTSAAYNDALLRGQFQNGLSVRMDGPKGTCIVWNLADPLDGDGWSSSRVEFIRQLLPHLRQFLSARQALRDAGSLGLTFGGMLERTGLGVLQLDWRGRIVAVNDYAANLLRQRSALFDKNGMLYAQPRRDNAALQALLVGALPGFGKQSAAGSMRLGGSLGGSGLTVHVHPVGPTERDSRPSGVAALVLVVESEVGLSIDPVVVEESLGLTPTESQVSALLAEGKTVAEIAKAWVRSERTIRWHIVQIFEKLGISRQAELVRQVLLLARGKNFKA